MVVELFWIWRHQFFIGGAPLDKLITNGDNARDDDDVAVGAGVDNAGDGGNHNHIRAALPLRRN